MDPNTNMASQPPPATVGFRTFNIGDILYLPYYNEIHVVVSSPPVIHTIKPPFSATPSPGAWTLSGDAIFYTPISPNVLVPPNSDSLLILPANIPAIQNPSAIVLRAQLGRCPWRACEDGFFAPENLSVQQDCKEQYRKEGGLKLACPVCHGWKVTDKDRVSVQAIAEAEGFGETEVTVRKIWKDREEWLNEERAELGLGPVRLPQAAEDKVEKDQEKDRKDEKKDNKNEEKNEKNEKKGENVKQKVQEKVKKKVEVKNHEKNQEKDKGGKEATGIDVLQTRARPKSGFVPTIYNWSIRFKKLFLEDEAGENFRADQDMIRYKVQK
ncbi:hypothetical protein EDC01DRAFT_626109 [Geopyxis carbonaria]|nr:hypothetical protein EDC01DRAFT_626109 [Geopyxis carbonaria]